MRKIAIAAPLLVLLAACGSNDVERAASGALIGAGVAAATNNNIAAGAGVGAAAGVFSDDLTN
ncbi:MAG: hypothetical protein AAFO93_14235 [Pseudomonadota bacterium]